MAYRSAVDGGYAAGASVVHTDSSHPESIHIEDAQLIFRGDYHRAGPDLVVTGEDGRHHIVPGYFSSERHADLVAPNGARLTADIIDLLAGSPAPGQYAQAQPTASPDPIGKVEKIVGDVHVVRNGISVALNVGDLVYKSDVIETGANSSVGIGFPDGTALDLVANTRMALNEYSFEPNTPSDNSALFTLVQGGFAFVAGEVAHNGTAGGGMKIATPVATMGIRGTAGYALEQVATVTANVGNVTITFALFADPGTDHVGSYVLIDQFGNEVAVNQAGVWTTLSWNGGNTPPSVSQAAMTPADFAIEQQLVPELTNILNNLPPSDFTHGANPQTPDSGHGSSTPPNVLNGTEGSGGSGPLLLTGQPINTPTGPATPTITVTSNSNSNSNNNNTLPSQPQENLPQENTGPDNWVGASPGPFNSSPNWSQGVPTGTESVVINAPQGFTGLFTVTVADSEAAASLTLGANVILDILTGGSFTVASGISNSGEVLLDSSGGDPVLMINGTVFLLDGGTIQMQGAAASNMIIGVGGTNATLVNVNNTIIGTGSIGQGDGNLHFTNGSLGVVEAQPLLAGDTGILTINTGNTDTNSGVFEAGAGGTLQISDPVTNLGAIIALANGVVTVGAVTIANTGGFLQATGADAQIDLFGTTIVGGALATSDGGIIRTPSGTSTFFGVTIGDGSFIETNDGTSILLQATTTLAGTVTFEGGGSFALNGASAAIVGESGVTVTLDNLGTISGSGDIGAGDALFLLTNESSGHINANGASALVLDNDSPAVDNFAVDAMVNAGQIIATGTGGLAIVNTTIVNSTFNGESGFDGTIEAGANSHIDLSNATILEGFVQVDSGGEIDTVAGTSNVIETANGPDHNVSTPTITIASGGLALVNDNSSLTLASPFNIENSGTIELDSTGKKTFLYFNQPFPILSGGGSIVLEGGAGAQDIIAGLPGDGFTTVSLDNQDNTISGAGAIGQGDQALTLTNGGTIDADVSGELLTVNTGNPFENDGVLAASNSGHLVVDDPLTNGGGTISIQGGGTVELNVTNSVVANFSGTGGTLQLDSTVTGGAAAGVDATATGTAAITITGAGNVTSTGADGIDATSAGGDIKITPSGSVSGAGNGIDATQNGNGNITISVGSDATVTATAELGIEAISKGTGDISVSTATGDTIDSGGSGILAENQATTIPASADSSISVTAEGAINSGTALTPAGNRPAGILAGYYVNGLPETGVTGSVTVDNFADVTAAAGDGIRAFNYGAGNVTVADEADTTIQTTGAAGQYGIEAYSAGTGNISVTTSADDMVDSASAGINAINQATAIAQSADSTITVSANGSIDSGTTLNTDGSRPAGIEAGYEGGTTATANAAVFGTVSVTNNANITALGGDGIRATNFGNGNVTVTDDANTAIQTTGAQGQYGIEAFSAGVGSLSVTMSTGDTIDANGTGILATDQATTIPAAADSSISVTAKGTINSGTNLTESGGPPGGILAGYNADGEAQSGVNGNVTVDNFANITAAAGDGIDAYDFGNGNVTITDEANTTVSATGANGIFGIHAFSWGVGNVAITMSAGDVVDSGSAGVVAVSFAASEPSSNSIAVTAAGTINSGTNTQDGGFPSAGILAGYNPNNTEMPDANVHGSVSVSSDATINAPAGYGIWAFNFGTGNVTVMTGADSAITASGPAGVVDGVSVPVGIGAYALGGGSASITNDGNVTVANGLALQAQASNGGEGTGTAAITNSGVVLGNGLGGGAVVDIGSDPGGSATLTNEKGGEIAPAALSAFNSASDLAISSSGGPITIDNAGDIVGQISATDAAFSNTGTWDIGGASTFAGSSGSIVNAGVVDAVGDASINPVVFTTEATGTDEAFAGGTLNLTLETGSWLYGLSDADGGQITADVQQGTGDTGTIEAANGGTNTITVESGGNPAVIGGNYGTIQALAGGTIDINGGTAGFLNGSPTAAEAIFGTETAPNGSLLNNGVVQALFGGGVDFTGTLFNAVNATIQAVGHGSTVTVADTVSDGSVVNNAGTMAALDGASLSITAQTLTNNPGGVISASGTGSSVSIAEGSDTNNGTVQATGGASLTVAQNVDGSVNNATVEATDGGMLTIDHITAEEIGVIGTNAATGVIEALNGGIVTLDDDRSDVNDGLIQAVNGGIVNIDLALDQFADGGSGPAGGDFGTFQALTGGTINVVGGSTIDSGGMADAIGFNATVAFSNTLSDTAVENLGQIFAQDGGTVSFNNVLISNGPSASGGGEFEANDGTLFVGSTSTLEGATPFNIVINADGVAEFDSLASTTAGTDHNIDVTFAGAGTFALAVAPSGPAIVTLTNFGSGDTLDLKNLTFTTAETATVSGSILTIRDGDATEKFTLAGTEPTNGQVVLISDPFGDTEAVFGTADVWTASSGDWNATNFGNWNSGSGPVPTLLNTAEITPSGITVTLTDSETVGNLVLGAPDSGGPTLDIGISASLLDSNALDIYAGGQINIDAGASFTVLGPIDSQGAITLNNQGDAANPATLTLAFGANHDTIGMLNDTGDNSIVDAEGTETLDNGTLSIGSSDGSHLINYDPGGVGATLELGPNLTIDQTGMAQIASTNATTAIDDQVVSFATINTSAGSTFFIQPDFFTNHGDINADQPGATLDIIPTGAFTNFGTVAASGGQTAQIENGFFSATQPEAVTNEAGGVISVSGVGSSLSIDSSAFVNSGVVEAMNGGNLQIEDPVNNSGTGELTANGGTIIVQGAVTGNGTSTVTGDGLLDFQSSVSADQTVAFTGPGTVKINAPASFDADISMAHADPSEVLDLGGFNSQAGDTFTTSTSLNAGITTLTVTDVSQKTSESVQLVGDFTGATWNVAADGSGGADISDPPPTTGAFLTTKVDGSTSELLFASNQINVASGQTATQSYENVVVPNPGNDNFMFPPGIGADTILDFKPQADTIELDHFANLQNLQQLASLIIPDAHGDALIELGHNDDIALPGVPPSFLLAHLQTIAHVV